MDIKLSTGRKLKIKSITRDAKDEIADGIEYNHVQNKDGDWDKLDIKSPQATITNMMRMFIIGGEFKKFTTDAKGQIADSCIDEFSMLERSDFFIEILKLVFGGNENTSD